MVDKPVQLDPEVLTIRPAMNGLLYLLIVHRNGEMVEYDLGSEVEWQPNADPIPMPRDESPWVQVTFRWWCSICSTHFESDPDCARCCTGQWAVTRYAIWKFNGDLYHVHRDGSVHADPYMTGEEVESRLREGSAR